MKWFDRAAIYGALFLAASAAGIAADVKWSAFPSANTSGGAVTGVGLQDGANVKFTTWGFGVTPISTTMMNIAAVAPVVGSEMVDNGSFTGSADSWTLGAGWSYGSNQVTHAPDIGATALSQDPLISPIVAGRRYRLDLTVGGTTGLVSLPTEHTVDAGAGAVSFEFTATPDDTPGLGIGASFEFDGSIDDVSLKELTPGSSSVYYHQDGTVAFIIKTDTGPNEDPPLILTINNGGEWIFSTDGETHAFIVGLDGFFGALNPDNFRALFNPNGVTANRTYALPDADGNVALESVASGTFTTMDGKTVTVTNGIITDITGP